MKISPLDLRHAHSGWEADTLYLGGGTPSRLGGEGVARLVGMLRERICLTSGAEVTLEANPEDVTPAAVAAWRHAGINRVSLGGQSFDEGVLRWMHRVHDAGAIVRAVDVVRDAGIASVSFDLIFALPLALGRGRVEAQAGAGARQEAARQAR